MASEKEISDSASSVTTKTSKEEKCKESELDENAKFIEWIRNNTAKFSSSKFERLDINTVSCCSNFRVDMWTKVMDKVPNSFSSIQDHLELTSSYFLLVKKSGSRYSVIDQSEWTKEKFSKQA